jgi:hypothetical protein
MRQQTIAILVSIALSLCSCTHTRSGPTYDSMFQNASPQTENSRIVVFRNQAFTGLYDRAWDIKVDGQIIGALRAGTFVYVDCPPGHHGLSLDLWDEPGTSRASVDTTGGHAYFFDAELNSNASKMDAGAAFGLVGMAAAASTTDNRGPIDFTPVDEVTGLADIASLHLADK